MLTTLLQVEGCAPRTPRMRYQYLVFGNVVRSIVSTVLAGKDFKVVNRMPSRERWRTKPVSSSVISSQKSPTFRALKELASRFEGAGQMLMSVVADASFE